MNLNRVASSLIITFAVIIALIYAQSIILPFIFALLIWFVVKKMRNLIDKSKFLKRYIPNWIKTLIASSLVLYIASFVGSILTANIESLSASYPQYMSNVQVIGDSINEIFKIDVQHEIDLAVQKFDFASYLQLLFNSISEILGSMVMIIFYVVFLFIEESLFLTKIRLIFPSDERFISVTQTMRKIDKLMSSYLSLKSLIALVASTLGYFVLLGVGIESPLFWAFIVFMFNFIPSIGPILSTILPAVFSLLQFGDFIPFFIILFGVGSISVLVGSLLEPKLMGNTLNISPLVAILSLAIWGSIWGIAGMLLCVPITVAMIIIFSQFQQTRSIAILLSERGRL